MEFSLKDLYIPILSFLWLFGALFIWPLFRYGLKIKSQMVTCLKVFFWLQIIGLFLSFGFIYYFYLAGYQDVLHAFIIPYGVSSLFWALTLIILLIGLFARFFENLKKS